MSDKPMENEPLLIGERTSFAVLKASGENLLTYLQGQLTQDVRGLDQHSARYSALLTPQAKAVSDLYLFFANDDEIVLLVPRSRAAEVLDRLKRFALGYELRMGVVSAMQVFSVQGSGVEQWLQSQALPVPESGSLAVATAQEGFVLRMPECSDEGVWVIGSQLQFQTNVSDEVLSLKRAVHGWPMFGVDWDEKVHPLNANLLEFGGVSFDKGCYVGQEVTSRMHWKGGVKKKLYRVSLSGQIDEPVLPLPVSSSVPIGMLTSLGQSQDGKACGIAMLPVSVVESGTELSVPEGIKVEVLGLCGRS